MTTRVHNATIERGFARARAAQRVWRSRGITRRIEVLRRFRRSLADQAVDVAESVPSERRATRSETLTSEVLPLLDACRFLERNAARVLRTHRPGRAGRPFWLTGTRCEIRREPHGVVLVIGPANYPLMLPGIQTLQALAAGNGVIWKPAPGGSAVARKIAELLAAAGLPEGLLTVTDTSIETATAALDAGPDKVILTGAFETGRKVLSRLGDRVVPATVELSGCDAAFVLEDADIDLVVRALSFGLRLNGGATCIGPRRVFVERRWARQLEDRLAGALRDAPAVHVEATVLASAAALVEQACAAGARLVTGKLSAGEPVRPVLLGNATAAMAIARSDIFAPVLALVPVDGTEEALRESARCPYSLGATIFGSPARACELASRVDAGVVVVNDMIVPTADPRLPFGGHGKSGFGVTRGAEGLLELTRPKSIVRRRGRFRPHFDPPGEREERWVPALLQLAHGSWAERLRWIRNTARESILGNLRGLRRAHPTSWATPRRAVRRGDRS